MEVVVDLVLGDGRKTGGVKLWAKELERVDTSKENGYAFEGRFLRKASGKAGWKYNQIDDVVAVGAYVVAIVQTGSWNHPRADIVLYRAEETGLKEVYRNEWKTSTKKQAIREIAEIVNKQEINEELKQKLQELIDRYGYEQVAYTLSKIGD
ncbi:MAG: hypothetical protein JRE40_12170 [Deltaproteobacteria bacterium]|nr:hypothetical protein [Deltaproteobacteria bacterium]